MARWRIDCQTCSKASSGGGLSGAVFPCTDDECSYTPYETTATSQSVQNQFTYESTSSSLSGDKVEKSDTATLDLGKVSAETQVNYGVPCLLCGESVEVTPYSPIYCICDRCKALWKELVVSRAIDSKK